MFYDHMRGIMFGLNVVAESEIWKMNISHVFDRIRRDYYDGSTVTRGMENPASCTS